MATFSVDNFAPAWMVPEATPEDVEKVNAGGVKLVMGIERAVGPKPEGCTWRDEWEPTLEAMAPQRAAPPPACVRCVVAVAPYGERPPARGVPPSPRLFLSLSPKPSSE